MQTSFPVPKMSYINTYIIVYNESKKGKKKRTQVILHCTYMLLSLGYGGVLSSPIVMREDVERHVLW